MDESYCRTWRKTLFLMRTLFREPALTRRTCLIKFALLLGILTLVPRISRAQLTTGTLEGTLRAADGHALGGTSLIITGSPNVQMVMHTNADGSFVAILPYGRYQISPEGKNDAELFGVNLFVAPLRHTRLDLVVEASGRLQGQSADAHSDIWTDATRREVYPEALSLQGVLLSREPSSVAQPLSFNGESDNRLAIESQWSFSWTDTQFKLQGMDATDSYQPGYPVILPDLEALEMIAVQSTVGDISSVTDGTEVDAFLAEPAESWHGSFSSADTGSALSSSNLPPPALRGAVQQADEFLWFTRDRLEAGGPVGKWADLYASAGGQWASQTVPLESPGNNQQSQSLFENVRGRFRAGAQDQFDVDYSGSSVWLSTGGMPAGLEAMARRMGPSFVLPGGFPGQQPEADEFSFFQVGWTHELAANSGLGTLQARYAYSIANLDTPPAPSGAQSTIELLEGAVTGAAPISNMATRTREEARATWQPGELRIAGTRHQILVGGGWETSLPVNRFTKPSDMNLITAEGAPAFVAEFNTPVDTRETVSSFSASAFDHATLSSHWSIDFGALVDLSRGSVPAQSSPAGSFAPARAFPAQPDLIAWNSVSPRAGVARPLPHFHRVIFRAGYLHMVVPLAGRYLDFGNPNSLGGSVYQWTSVNSNGQFQPSEQGELLLRFGGPYSSVSPTLRRPYEDELNLGLDIPVRRGSLNIRFFRRDSNDRLAVLDTGVPDSAYTPVSIVDPGADGIVGTSDDQHLTVYQQNPATLGQDQYLLTNPPHLTVVSKGFLGDLRMQLAGLALHASVVGENYYGPSNPGDSVLENDPGVVGNLLMDPNTSVNAAGQSFTDRAYLAKIQATYRLPTAWGGIELASLGNYLDGLTFARQLLVTGLAQGPFLVATTPRGSVGLGNRTDSVGNWNLRLSREFPLSAGRVAASADILNVTNMGHSLQVSDLTGPSFNLMLPEAIQPPRMVRIELRYDF
jgi:hypothetical protein